MEIHRWLAVVCLHSVPFLFTIVTMEGMSTGDGSVTGMFPKDPVVATGDNLTVICNHTFNGTAANKTVHDLNFVFTNVVYNSSSPSFSVLDQNTAQLLLPRMTRNLTNKHVYCYLDKLHDHVTIQVLDPPLVPKLEKCIVYNWENMTCTWGPIQPQGVVTSLYWSVLRNEKSMYHCRHFTPYNCTWKEIDGKDSFHRGASYYLTIQANHTTLDRVVLSEEETVDTTIIVKPNPVKNLWVMPVNSSTLSLSWKAPVHVTATKNVSYRYTYKSIYDSHTENTTHLTDPTKLNITNLIPYTEYEVIVDCIPLVKDYNTGLSHPKGYWSNQVKVSNIRTLEDVPGVAPRVIDGGFHYDIIPQHNERSITILWQNIPEKMRHGIIRRWKITYQDSKKDAQPQELIVANEDKTYHVIPGLKSNQTYKFTVDAATSKGFNTSLQLKTIVVASDELKPSRPSEFAVFGNDSGAFLHWEKVEGASGYTVYFCLGSPQLNTCKGGTSIEWIKVGHQNTSIGLFLETGIDVFSYIFAVSSEKQASLENGERVIVSSGMMWSDCTYQIGKGCLCHGDSSPWEVVKPPEDFEAHSLEGNSISLTWKKPGCAETGYISGYEVQYCREDLCEEDWIILDVRNDSRLLVIPNLEEDQAYRVRIRSLSPKEHSRFVELEEPFTVTITGLKQAHLILIIVFCVVAAVLITAGLVATIRYCKKKVDIYKNVQIEPPEKFHDPSEDVDETSGKEDWSGQYISPNDNQTKLDENDKNYWKEHLTGPGNGHVHLYMNGHAGERPSGWAKYEKDPSVSGVSGNAPEQIALLSDQDGGSPPQVPQPGYHPAESPPGPAPSGTQNLPGARASLQVSGERPTGFPPQDSHSESAGLDSGLSSMMAYSAVQPNSVPKIKTGVSITPYSQLDGGLAGQSSAQYTTEAPSLPTNSAQTDSKHDDPVYSVPSELMAGPAGKTEAGPGTRESDSTQPPCDNHSNQPAANSSVDAAGQRQALPDKSTSSSGSPPNLEIVPPASASYVSVVSPLVSASSGSNGLPLGGTDAVDPDTDNRTDTKSDHSAPLSQNCDYRVDVEGSGNSCGRDSGCNGETTSSGGNYFPPHSLTTVPAMAPQASDYITQDHISQMGTPVN